MKELFKWKCEKSKTKYWLLQRLPKSVKKTEKFCKLQESCSRRCAGNPKETIDHHNNSRCLKTEEFRKRVLQKDLYWNVKNPKEPVNNYSRYPQVSWRLKNFEKSLFKKIFINKMDFKSIKNVNIVCTHYLILQYMPN